MCNKSSLEGTLCAAMHKCYDSNDLNKCMGKATMDGLRRLAEMGLAVATVFAWGVGTSFTMNGSFRFYVKAFAGVNLIVRMP